ncbi:copper-translocating P-type ATPase ZntA-like protein [Psychroflexus torquis ATCC 700755]|uniref:Copper-translocating P-type ATPase ZntA-like protein n=1 Tax=Psychroflexus torquis (strain ATCC 700755 / CIP 106069 / ACAM 623) TaxID=313595 RepID=K4II57_PSYTT|nr:heavy metal translocating P-type ATPase metal-binding domain-containing protein [Psychroflexus torquis]AFU69478.1 copper-translocating P-type ATPase ZntA-like protein [Psychroflexus torquis ATCC 700755]
METCYHCGDACPDPAIVHQEKYFCCNGCKTVFDILNENDLTYYYDLQATPGKTPLDFEDRFDYLDNQNIIDQLLEFDEQETQVVSFVIPNIHCSSCIWVLENLDKLHPAVKSGLVNFPQKSICISYDSSEISLKELVLLLCRIGYEPNISLEDFNKKEKNIDRSLIYKLGVAGFAFGNIMFLSFPEYFEVSEFWLDEFKFLFRWLMFAFALPVVFYSARDYFISAYKGLRAGILNIDVPIAIGILVLFLRSTLEIIMDWGTGFFDSMVGLVFFLLLGKFFQQKTYAFLSFERDYKSYFPIAVTQLIKSKTAVAEDNCDSQSQPTKTKQNELQTPVYEVKPGDRILIRNNELIPTDGILMKGNALIDYSFVTGEAAPVAKKSGDKIYAGGKQKAGIIEIEVTKAVEQSYLTQLWNNKVFSKTKATTFENLTDQISRRFTISILSIAFVAGIIWIILDPSKAFNVFTAVLIVACPCAIALAAPFTLGNMLRIFGKQQLYLKDSSLIEQMAQIDTVVFDKTGTLTSHQKNLIVYKGVTLTENEQQVLTSTLRASNHPLSRALYEMLQSQGICTLDNFSEVTGKGVVGVYGSTSVKAGSFAFVSSGEQEENATNTQVHVSTNDEYKGTYVFYNNYREGMEALFSEMSNTVELVILSGDNDGEKNYLKSILPKSAQLKFNQKPDDKLNFIEALQQQGKKVMMIGDGLNDAGALAQSNIGIAVSENVNVFSPACDGIIDATKLKELTAFMSLSKASVRVIKYAFIFSLFYNLIGLGFALTGNLSPVVAAILMPLSSISIVIFTTLSTFLLGRRFNF